MPPRRKRIADDDDAEPVGLSAAGLPPVAVIRAVSGLKPTVKSTPSFGAKINRIDLTAITPECRPVYAAFDSQRRPAELDDDAVVQAIEAAESKDVTKSLTATIGTGVDLLAELAAALEERRTKETEQIESKHKSPKDAVAAAAKLKFSIRSGQKEAAEGNDTEVFGFVEKKPKKKKSVSKEIDEAAMVADLMKSGGTIRKTAGAGTKTIKEAIDAAKDKYLKFAAKIQSSKSAESSTIREFFWLYYRLWRKNQQLTDEDHILSLFEDANDDAAERSILNDRRKFFAEPVPSACLDSLTTADQFESFVRRLSKQTRDVYEQRLLRRIRGDSSIDVSAARGEALAAAEMLADLAEESDVDIAEAEEEEPDVADRGDICKTAATNKSLSTPLSETKFLQVLADVPAVAYSFAAGPPHWFAGFYNPESKRNDLAGPPGPSLLKDPILQKFLKLASPAIDAAVPELTDKQRTKLLNDERKLFLKVVAIKYPPNASLLPEGLNFDEGSDRGIDAYSSQLKRQEGKLGNIGIVVANVVSDEKAEEVQYVEAQEVLRHLAVQEAVLILKGRGRIPLRAINWMFQCGDKRAVQDFLAYVHDGLVEPVVKFGLIGPGGKPGDPSGLVEATRYAENAAKALEKVTQKGVLKNVDVHRRRLLIETELKRAAGLLADFHAEGKHTAAETKAAEDEAFTEAATEIARYYSAIGSDLPSIVPNLGYKKGKTDAKEVPTPYATFGTDIPYGWIADAGRTLEAAGIPISTKNIRQFWTKTAELHYYPYWLRKAAEETRKRADKAGKKDQESNEVLEPLAIAIRDHPKWRGYLTRLLTNDVLQLGKAFETMKLTEDQIEKAADIGLSLIGDYAKLKRLYPAVAKAEGTYSEQIAIAAAKEKLAAKELKGLEAEERLILTAEEKKELGIKKTPKKGTKAYAALQRRRKAEKKFLEVEAAQNDEDIEADVDERPAAAAEADLTAAVADLDRLKAAEQAELVSLGGKKITKRMKVYDIQKQIVAAEKLVKQRTKIAETFTEDELAFGAEAVAEADVRAAEKALADEARQAAAQRKRMSDERRAAEAYRNRQNMQMQM